MIAAFEILLCVMILGTAAVALFVRDALAAIAFFIVMGNLLGLAWLALDAVNVALAELAIGAGVTGILLILTRARLAAAGDAMAPAPVHPVFRVGAALVASGFTAVLAAVVFAIAPDAGLQPVIATLMPGLGIENPVTGVLLAFRAYDTLLESFVLLGALVAVWSVAPVGGWPHRPAALAIDDPAGRVVAEAFARLLVPLSVLVAAYVVWAGSDLPGGAFQAGTVLAGGLLIGAIGGAIAPPPVASLLLRLALIFGPLVFLMIGLAGAAMGRFLAYPTGLEKTLIVTIEYALTLSIGVTLAMLVAGPPVARVAPEAELDPARPAKEVQGDA